MCFDIGVVEEFVAIVSHCAPKSINFSKAQRCIAETLSFSHGRERERCDGTEQGGSCKPTKLSTRACVRCRFFAVLAIKIEGVWSNSREDAAIQVVLAMLV